jgi:hypothetical protein
MTGALVGATVAMSGLLPSTAGAAAEPGTAPTAEELVASDFSLYFVNAGASVTDSVNAPNHLGVYQSRSDQQLGADPETGSEWGYVIDDTSNPVARSVTGSDPWQTLRYDAEPAEAALSDRELKYAFQLPAGTYDVTFGFDVPDGWTARSVVLRAEGQDLATYDTGTNAGAPQYAVAVSDGVLNVSIASPADRTGSYVDPVVNFISVKAQADWTDVSLVGEKVRQTELTAEQAATYSPETVANLEAAQDKGQSLVDAGSTDSAANKSAYEGIAAAYSDLQAASSGKYSSFRPGDPWTDTADKAIQAHGGQVLTTKDATGRTVYYWYGEDRTNGYSSSPGVHAYSSYDLYNWTDRGLVLRAMTDKGQFDSDPYFSELYAGYTDAQKDAVYRDLGTKQVDGEAAAILERPKVIHNESTGKWVLWVHADGPSSTSTAQYAKANAGVAISDSPFGPFRYIDSYRLHVAPEGEQNWKPESPGMARDMNLFVDDDGTAYIIYASEENATLFISKLNDDYTQLATPAESAVKGVDFTRTYLGASREAPALFKYNGKYYLITSAATGWDANAAKWASATDILGEWTDHGNPVVGDGADNTCDSQSTAVIPVDPASGKFIFMADRWTEEDLKNAPYIWLPIDIAANGDLSITCRGEWTLDDLQPAGTS